jgi:hypothetical protein
VNIEILPQTDVRYLDDLLFDEGLVRPVYAEQLRTVPHNHLRIWCSKNAVYQIPTWELLSWLEKEIAGRTAIEICAGNSCLGRHLGIRMFDNAMQTWPGIRDRYLMLRQTPIDPPPDVERMDANEAVSKYKPEVVIGAWVTQRWVEGTEDGSIFGPNEHAILDTGCAYIHIGNLAVHKSKRILIRPHRELHLPWLFGRGTDPLLNRVWVCARGA